MVFSITYETVTPESAELGDADERGWIIEPNDAYSFSDCYSTLRSAGAIGTYCEADEYPLRAPRTLTFYRVDEDYRTGAETSWSLHIPAHVTPASRRRIARLFKCNGA